MARKTKRQIGPAAAIVAEMLLEAEVGSLGAMKGAGGKERILRHAVRNGLPGRGKNGIGFEILVARIWLYCEDTSVSEQEIRIWLRKHGITEKKPKTMEVEK